jgi:hypothetical protein
MTLAAAMITSALLSAIGAPYSRWLCWFSWSRSGAMLGTAVFLAIGAVAGVVGVASGQGLFKAQPTSNDFLDGVLYGLAGALAFRADLRIAQRRPSTSARNAQGQLSGPLSVLSLGLQWVSDALDEWTRRRVEVWLSGLNPRHLSRLAFRVSSRISADLEIPTSAKKTLQDSLVPAMEDLNNRDPQTSESGRQRLEGFLAQFIVDYHHDAQPLRAAVANAPS